MMKYKNYFLFVLSLLHSSFAFSEPTSVPVLIHSIRPYLTGGIFVQVQTPVICDTTVFLIDASFGGAKEMYSGALSAMMAGKKIHLEINNSTGCTGWGTMLQSLTVLAQ